MGAHVIIKGRCSTSTTANKLLMHPPNIFDIIKIEKGGGFMMTYTSYDPDLLKQWCAAESNSTLFDAALDEYLRQFQQLFRMQSQKLYFTTFIKGLFSQLDRKSLEPIALHFLGENSVRPMQQFFTRSPLKEQALMERYQELLSSRLSAPGGMLSVDDSGFVKKGCHSVGVKRQYCGRLGKRENCQVGVFLAYAGCKGYGLVDRELYIPQEWYAPSHDALRRNCHIPSEKTFATKNKIAGDMVNKALESGQFQVQWIGCDAAYGNDHEFLDHLQLPPGVWYFAATNSKEQVFMEYPEMTYPKTKRGRPRKHPDLSVSPVNVQRIAQDPDIPWERIALAEGAKGPIFAQRKRIRCYSSRMDGNRCYQKPGEEIWLYLRRYADGTIKYFVSNAPKDISIEELDRAATLRWPIEQCFEECKSYLGMSHYESRSYEGWMRHMLFVMIAHLFTTQIKELMKKRGSN